jgi:hypothetical protein
MYAHQVIEDLKYNIKLENDIKNNIERNIKNSIKFHFGAMKEVQAPFKDMLKKCSKTRLFLDFNEYLKFPFEVCWFDYGHSEIPGLFFGSLTVMQDIDSFMLLHFIKDEKNTHGRWGISPSGLKIRIGKYFNDTPDTNVKHFLTWNNIHNGFDLEEYSQKFSAFEVSFIQMALMLLNCKNISTENNYPSMVLNKKRIKQGKQPLFKYHTLVINPVNEKKRSSGEHEPTGIKQRLHFCRGHFKEYTEQNKLFGKHTGLYWWQPMVRGNKELGLVHKDYEVRAA